MNYNTCGSPQGKVCNFSQDKNFATVLQQYCNSAATGKEFAQLGWRHAKFAQAYVSDFRSNTYARDFLFNTCVRDFRSNTCVRDFRLNTYAGDFESYICVRDFESYICVRDFGSNASCT